MYTIEVNGETWWNLWP